ncbi:MAG: cysteine desulfurase NifS [Verrucomicrobia bacterium]|nr:cysteine desulfurase NifS [Verrucomicrobiota bacterium]
MSQRKIYYFDNNATKQVAPEVIDAMMPFLTELWGNPSSAYSFGNQVGKHVEEARARVASLINADPREVVFTSCGTESNNSAIHSAFALNPDKRHFLTTAVEHSATIKFSEFLKKQGHIVTFLPVEADGSLDLHLLEKSIRPDTAIVSVMWGNNETGVVFPIEEIAAICQSKGVLFHTDAVQAAGKLPIDMKAVGADFISVSAHKLHAPKGIGALYVKRRTRYQPYVIGGHQERDRRGGTENVAGIVGFGRAAELARDRLTGENTQVRRLRDRMEETIVRTIPDAMRNGAKEPRLPNTSNIAFAGIEAEAILMLLDRLGICASSGSACTTGSLEPSHVLRAMGLSPERARGSVRFSLGFYNTDADVDFLLQQLPPIIEKLRAISPLNPEPSAQSKRESRAGRSNHPEKVTVV